MRVCGGEGREKVKAMGLFLCLLSCFHFQMIKASGPETLGTFCKLCIELDCKPNKGV